MRILNLLTLVTALYVSSRQMLVAQEFGVDYDVEMQADFRGHCNLVNLLSLHVDFPLHSHWRFDASCIIIAKTRNQSLLNDLQTFSNIEADNQPFALSLAGIGWNPNEGHLLFGGIRNVNEDYFVSPVTSLFVNSSCGIFPTLSCNMDIANYPLASLGMHYSYTASTFCLQASVYNGQGYSDLTGAANIWRFTPQSDGLFCISQVDWQQGKGHYFVGGAQLRRFGDKTEGHSAIWAYTEQTLTEQVSLIADCSHAFGCRSECLDFVGIGCVFASGTSVVGLFTDYASFRHDSEWATELTYKHDFGKYLYLQASFQQIHHERWQSVGLIRMGIRI